MASKILAGVSTSPGAMGNATAFAQRPSTLT